MPQNRHLTGINGVSAGQPPISAKRRNSSPESRVTQAAGHVPWLALEQELGLERDELEALLAVLLGCALP